MLQMRAQTRAVSRAHARPVIPVAGRHCEPLMNDRTLRQLSPRTTQRQSNSPQRPGPGPGPQGPAQDPETSHGNLGWPEFGGLCRQTALPTALERPGARRRQGWVGCPAEGGAQFSALLPG